MASNENTYSVSYSPTFSRYPVPAGQCEHPPEVILIVGGYHPGTNPPRPYGRLCMDCGTELTGDIRTSFAIWALHQQYGWHARIGRRLCELAIRAERHERAEEALNGK